MVTAFTLEAAFDGQTIGQNQSYILANQCCHIIIDHQNRKGTCSGKFCIFCRSCATDCFQVVVIIGKKIPEILYYTGKIR